MPNLKSKTYQVMVERVLNHEQLFEANGDLKEFPEPPDSPPNYILKKPSFKDRRDKLLMLGDSELDIAAKSLKDAEGDRGHRLEAGDLSSTDITAINNLWKEVKKGKNENVMEVIMQGVRDMLNYEHLEKKGLADAIAQALPLLSRNQGNDRTDAITLLQNASSDYGLKDDYVAILSVHDSY